MSEYYGSSRPLSPAEDLPVQLRAQQCGTGG
ncbi:hypothetical protein [Enterobacter phage 04_vB_Eclo_IJM]|nr:hypothetical protein [Enterobacter phage 04_vB_Eclo_IJM]